MTEDSTFVYVRLEKVKKVESAKKAKEMKTKEYQGKKPGIWHQQVMLLMEPWMA